MELWLRLRAPTPSLFTRVMRWHPYPRSRIACYHRLQPAMGAVCGVLLMDQLPLVQRKHFSILHIHVSCIAKKNL